MIPKASCISVCDLKAFLCDRLARANSPRILQSFKKKFFCHTSHFGASSGVKELYRKYLEFASVHLFTATARQQDQASYFYGHVQSSIIVRSPVRVWPPNVGSLSKRVTSAPFFCSNQAHDSPEMPEPTTAILLEFEAFC